MAKAQGDETLDRPWSKHSIGSSAFKRKNPDFDDAKRKRDQKGDDKHSSAEVEEKKRRFREFLNMTIKQEASGKNK